MYSARYASQPWEVALRRARGLVDHYDSSDCLQLSAVLTALSLVAEAQMITWSPGLLHRLLGSPPAALGQDLERCSTRRSRKHRAGVTSTVLKGWRCR